MRRAHYLTLVMATCIIAGSTFATENTLRIGSHLNPRSTGISQVIKPWTDAVRAEAGDAVTIVEYWGGSLGKSPAKQFELVRSGVLDIAWILPGYTPGQFPEMGLFELPFLFDSSLEAATVGWQLYDMDQFLRAEIDALMDTSYFIRRAQSLYGYPNFICDTGGSICEWVDPDDANDPIMTALAKECLCVWIEGSDAHIDELCRRFDKAPKPMSYQPEFLTKAWADYLAEKSVSPDDVNPDDFIRWTYRKALDHRQPRYRAMANRWGITVKAEDIYAVRSAEDFQELIARTLEARA